MLKQTAKYAVARWLPGLVNIAAIALYTRLLTQDEYGTYALAVAWVALVNALAFQWLRSGVRRFLIANREDRPGFLATVGRAFLGLCLLVLLLGVAVLLWQSTASRRWLVLAGVLLVLSQAWLDLNLDMVLAEVRPARYGAAMLVRSLVSLAAGAGLAATGFGAVGMLAGIAGGYVASGIWLGVLQWRGVGGRRARPEVRAGLWRYGLPLTFTFGLDFIVNSSDRLLLGWLAGTEAVGAYAASYDLSQQGMTALMITVNLGAFSMAVRALELGGVSAAQAQLRRHAVVLMGLALPATVGLALLAPNIAHVVLGSAFRLVGAQLIPIIAVAAFLAGLKAYYFDLAFQLGHSTLPLVWSGGSAAVANVALNLVLIPRYGAMGAAWATLAAFALGLGLSIALRGRGIAVPVPWRAWGGIVVASTVMAGVLWMLRAMRGFPGLSLQIAAGGLVFGAVTLLLDVGQLRTLLLARLAAQARS